jgi:hypothetical protein
MAEETHKHEELLVEDGTWLAIELTGVDLLGEKVEINLSDVKIGEVGVAVEWKDKATREEYVLGSQYDSPIWNGEMQQVSLQQKS